MTYPNLYNYIKYNYGVEDNQIQNFEGEIILTPSHIFHDSWIASFGDPYSEKVIANANQFSFADEFNCLNPSTLQNGSGTIISIKKNQIEIRTDFGIMLLKLSSCSRIQSTFLLPRAGQKLYWKGNIKEGNIVEVYSATSL